MDTINLDQGAGRAAIRAAGVLRQGGVLLYPTDTIYGLGADAFTDETVDAIYAIKGREAQNPISCVVADLAMAEKYVEVNDAARALAERFLPGPLTLILKKQPGTDRGIARGIPALGIRIPNNEFCLELARTYGRPFTTTSANLAGQPTLGEPGAIIEQLGDMAAGVTLVVNSGVVMGPPSTVVNLVSGHPSVLREGAIAATDIVSPR